ncbi:MAG: transcription termination factor NusA [Candidatus Melainabacteria bacterium]
MIKVGTALMEHAEQLERERGISKEIFIDSLREAMVAAYKKYASLKTSGGIECEVNERTGEIGIYEQRVIVEELNPESEVLEMTLKEARRIKPDVEEGDILEMEVTPDDFGRIAAQAAKQVITQRIREAEKSLIQKEFEEKQGTVVTGIVQRIEGRNVILNIGRGEAVLPPKEQIPSEYYRIGNKVRVYVADLRDSGRVPQIIVSQAHPEMVREVFELEVPEIEDGLVEIKAIAREAGFRTKVAVTSHDPDVDPQGACIGTRGSRIQAIVNELKNEKIDIILWSPDTVSFITNALAPAKIVKVELIVEEDRPPRAIVVVPDDQLSLAIGREGQNVRLAAKISGYKLDIKSLTQLEEEYRREDEALGQSTDAPAAASDETPESEAAPETPEATADAGSQETEATAEVTEEAPEQEPVETT